MFSISVSPCVATSLTVRWLAHAPQPIAKQVYSATCFLSSAYAGTKGERRRKGGAAPGAVVAANPGGGGGFGRPFGV